METTQTITLPQWALVVGILVNIGVFSTAIYQIVHSLIFLRSEKKSSNTKVKKEELEYTQQVENAADKAAEKALSLNQQLMDLRLEMQTYKATQAANDIWKKRAEETMKSQADRITYLECKLNNSETLIKVLAGQVVELNGIPATMTSLNLSDCNEEGSKP